MLTKFMLVTACYCDMFIADAVVYRCLVGNRPLSKFLVWEHVNFILETLSTNPLPWSPECTLNWGLNFIRAFSNREFGKRFIVSTIHSCETDWPYRRRLSFLVKLFRVIFFLYICRSCMNFSCIFRFLGASNERSLACPSHPRARTLDCQ